MILENKTINENLNICEDVVIIRNCIFNHNCEIFINHNSKIYIEIENNTFDSKVPIHIKQNNFLMTMLVRFNKFLNPKYVIDIDDSLSNDSLLSATVCYNKIFNPSTNVVSNFTKNIAFVHSNLFYKDNIIDSNTKYSFGEILLNHGYETTHKLENIEEEITKQLSVDNFFSKENTNGSHIINIKNIPQYVSFENDPALLTGCETTSVSIVLSFLLKRRVTKNETALLMPKKPIGKCNYWENFVGNIENGFGCMSDVVIKTIHNFFDKNELKNYKVINLTGIKFDHLLKLIDKDIPVIIWATMGNDEGMFFRKTASTKWIVDGKNLWWNGNEHCMVLAGYDLKNNTAFLCDPEKNDETIRTRKLDELRSRFMSFYSQAVIIVDNQNLQN